MIQSDIAQIVSTYLANEDNNFHCENLVLLAENFGTPEDITRAKQALDDRNAGIRSVAGSYDFQCSLWNKISPEFKELYGRSPGSDEED